jgi:AcrR family transcriptional regulator
MRFQHTVDNESCQDDAVSLPATPVRRNFRGVTPEQREAQRRARLVEAGLEAFGTRGFHGVGVRDVCTIAKLTERYFYESFENREALFLAVYQEAARRIRVAVAEAHARAEPSINDLARSGLEATLSSFRDDPRLARILLLEVFAVGSAVGEARFDVSQAFADDIAFIARGFHPGLPKTGLSPEIIGNGLYGSTVYIAMRWALGGFREPLEAVLEHCLLFYEALNDRMVELERSSGDPSDRPT